MVLAGIEELMPRMKGPVPKTLTGVKSFFGS
jgi:hypothetical protein